MNGYWIGHKDDRTTEAIRAIIGKSIRRLLVGEVVIYGWVLGEI